MQKTILNGDNGKRPIVISASKIASALGIIVLGLGTWGLTKVSSVAETAASRQMVVAVSNRLEENIQILKTETKDDIKCLKNEALVARESIKAEAAADNKRIEDSIQRRIDRLEDSIFNKLDHIQTLLENKINGRRAEGTEVIH